MAPDAEIPADIEPATEAPVEPQAALAPAEAAPAPTDQPEPLGQAVSRREEIAQVQAAAILKKGEDEAAALLVAIEQKAGPAYEAAKQQAEALIAQAKQAAETHFKLNQGNGEPLSPDNPRVTVVGDEASGFHVEVHSGDKYSVFHPKEGTSIDKAKAQALKAHAAGS